MAGHCLMAAGAFELALTVLQMKNNFIYGIPHLNNPIDTDFNWVRGYQTIAIEKALCLSYAFSRINTSVVLKKG